jgi:hypothetical protein
MYICISHTSQLKFHSPHVLQAGREGNLASSVFTEQSSVDLRVVSPADGKKAGWVNDSASESPKDTP